MKIYGKLVKDNGSIIVSIPSHGTYKIDGEIVKNGKQAIIAPNQSLTVVNQPVAQLTHYVNKNGKIISIQDYNRQLIELSKHMDDDEEFENIDDEYNYKKFKSNNVAQYRHTDQSESDVEIEVIEVVIDTGNRNITPIWANSKTNDVSRLYEFNQKQFVFDTMIETASKFKLKIEGVEGSLSYVKIEGSYVKAFNELHLGQIVSSMDDIKNRCGNISSFIEKFMKIELAKKMNSVNVDLKMILELIDSVEASVKSLEVKVKSESTQRNCLIKLRDARVLITNEIV